MTTLTRGVQTPLTKSFIIVILLLFPHNLSAKYSSKYSDNNLKQQINRFVQINNTRDNNLTVGKLLNNIEHVSKNNINFTDNLDEGTMSKQMSNRNKPSSLMIISECVKQRGIEDCLKIFLIRRIERIRQLISEKANVSINFDSIQTEIQKNFDWQKYKNIDGSNLDGMVMRQLQGFVGNKRIKLVLRPGIDLELNKLKDGSLQMNIRKDKDLELPRGKKATKMFYAIVPMLLIPPLIMSAILPFVLPALKMMIMGTALLNQMALGGAVFTLLRNGIFNDEYEKKVIYVNQGYKNEHKPPPIIYHQSFKKPSIQHTPQIPSHFDYQDHEHHSDNLKKHEFGIPDEDYTGISNDQVSINIPHSFKLRSEYKIPVKNKIIEFNDEVIESKYSNKQHAPTFGTKLNYFSEHVNSFENKK